MQEIVVQSTKYPEIVVQGSRYDYTSDIVLVVVGILVLFVGFWMVQAPDSLATFAADSGAWLWDMTSMVFGSIIDFLNALFD